MHFLFTPMKFQPNCTHLYPQPQSQAGTLQGPHGGWAPSHRYKTEDESSDHPGAMFADYSQAGSLQPPDSLSWVVQRMQPDPSLRLWVPLVHPAGHEGRWCPGEVAQQRGEYCWELFRAQFEDVVLTQSLPNSSTIALSRYANWWSQISAQINFLLGGRDGADWPGLVKQGTHQLDRKLV